MGAGRVERNGEVQRITLQTRERREKEGRGAFLKTVEKGRYKGGTALA